MEIRVLRYFLAAAREENITRASEILHVAQPTLSKQLIELEKQLDTKLFIRGSRKITLTEDGIFLRKRAQEIVDLADKTSFELKNSDKNISGDVYIGAGETAAVRYIAKTAKILQQSYPDIRYHLYSGNAYDVTEKLDKGLIDFGVLIGFVNIQKYDYLKLPLNDTWGLLVHKDSELAKLDYVTPNALKKLPLIVSNQSFLNNELSGWLGYNLDNLNIVATYNLIYNASFMVEEGIGYALCIDKLINVTGKGNLCFKPLYPKLEAGIDIVWKRHQTFSKASEKFLKILQENITSDFKF